MSGAYFYIEYRDGRVTQIEFRTAKMAQRAYNLYSKEPEDTADGWGWDEKRETPTLAQQIRMRRIK